MEVVPIDEKTREGRFRWFNHVLRRVANALVSSKLIFEGTKKKGKNTKNHIRIK